MFQFIYSVLQCNFNLFFMEKNYEFSGSDLVSTPN